MRTRNLSGSLTILLAFILMGSLCKGCGTPRTGTKHLYHTDEKFGISRGVNISHWLSQSNDKGQKREGKLNYLELENLKKQGFDHIRLPVEQHHIFTPEGAPDPDGIRLIHNAIKWSEEAGLKIILDYHIIDAHHFNDKDNSLWTNPEVQEDFVRMWRILCDEFGAYPTDLLAYELLNEPVAPDHDQWNDLAEKLIREIRKTEPERVILLGSNLWNGAGTFKYLRVPENDPNIILTFHFYEPFLLTHYRTGWSEFAGLPIDVAYPGNLYDPSSLENVSEPQRKAVERFSGSFDRIKLEDMMRDPIEVAKTHNLKLHCGEFGCFNTVPHEARMAWLEDVVAIFRDNGIAYTHWEYKHDFGFANPDGSVKNKPLLDILIND